ncbi:universal stress protein [Saccharothrix longispora]|uniref:Nucleotide-binding universal stress UspA family protein n=1 Tax=Saccharothrix longispora TaxID=33920 RepID=A0ABU1PP14_9PSEU|nr:universal stress protein [Saccharothrix longispora]MDR6591819.1 nucleotide-binding universal stress UspA family protein [Saccharothrix longispora]
MALDANTAPPPVVVLDDGSPRCAEAVRWATAHAALLGAPLERHRPTRDAVHDLMLVSTRAEVLVVGHRGVDGTPLGLNRLVVPLARHAACDVVVVRGTPEALDGRHHRVTALVTGGALDDLTLTRAADLAGRRGADLRVLHAVPPLAVRADRPDVPVRHADRVLRGVRHTSVLARMHPHEAVTRYADTDLLVLADRGPTARAALYHARCPVLVAHRVPAEARHTTRPGTADPQSTPGDRRAGSLGGQ